MNYLVGVMTLLVTILATVYAAASNNWLFFLFLIVTLTLSGLTLLRIRATSYQRA